MFRKIAKIGRVFAFLLLAVLGFGACEQGGDKSDSVENEPEIHLLVEGCLESINIGQSFQIHPIVYSDGEEVEDPEIGYSSTNANIASIYESGVVSGISAGECHIVVKYKKKMATSRLVVNNSGLSLNHRSLDMKRGKSEILIATLNSSDSSSTSISWYSNNDNVATVSSSGVVSAIGEGQATITAFTTDGSGGV